MNTPLLLAYASAIARNESGGNYSALGPKHPKYGHALGKYQVMASNVPSWTKEALGQEVSADQFLKSPEIQDKVFQHKFGGYVQKYGNPQDAASAWFTGRPLAEGANKRDSLGTSGAEYVNKFNAGLGLPQQSESMKQAPAQLATNTIASPLPEGGKRQKAMADLLMKQATANTPVYSTGEGIAKLLAGAMAGYQSGQAEQKDTSRAQALAQMLQGQGVNSPLLGALDGEGLEKVAALSVAEQMKPKEAKLGVIGQDQYGVNQYGWIDERKQQINPLGTNTQTEAATPIPQGQPAPDMAQALPAQAPVQIPPPPPGVDPKIWRAKQTEMLVEQTTPAGAPNPNMKLTEQQSKDLGFYKRGMMANETLSAMEGALLGGKDNFVQGVPFVGDMARSTFTSDSFKKADQAAREVLAVILRKDTGAAVTPSEFETYSKIYIPQYGDPPELIQQKKAARDQAFQSLQSGLGTARPLSMDGQQPPQPQTQQQTAPQTSNAPPQQGQIIDGYFFKGGDPADAKNWEPAA